MLDADGLVLKVNGIPFQANNFTAPQAVECSHNSGRTFPDRAERVLSKTAASFQRNSDKELIQTYCC